MPGARLIPTGPRQRGYGSLQSQSRNMLRVVLLCLRKKGFLKQKARGARKARTNCSCLQHLRIAHAPEYAKPFQRGINSNQLMNDGALVDCDDLLAGRR